MPIQQRTLHRTALSTLAALAFASGSCSCESQDGTRQLDPVLVIRDLPVDPQTGELLVDFGVVPIGSTAIRTVIVSNTGTAPLSVIGTAPGLPFGLDLPAGGLRVPVSGRAEFHFTFAPSDQGDEPAGAVVALGTNERGASSHRFRLVGRGASPGFDCAPSEVDFGPVVIGQSKKVRTICTNRIDAETAVLLDDLSGRSKDQFAALVLDAGAIPGEPFRVKARGTIEIEIAANAASEGVNPALLRLRDGSQPSSELARVHLTMTGVRSAVLLEPAPCLDIGQVTMGDSKQSSFTIRNIGAHPVVVDGAVVDAGASSEFEVTSALPITVHPDGEAAVDVRFLAAASGERMATVTFHASGPKDPDGATFTGCVSAFAGGPLLSCDPAAIDFGTIAVGFPVTRTLRCSNAGIPSPDRAIEPLQVDDVYTTRSVFLASKAGIRNPDGTTGARTEGYPIDDSFTVEVVYAPAAEGADSGEIAIETSATPGGLHVTPVSGRGREFPPCRYDLHPAALDFGTVDRAKTRTLTFTVVNTLDTGPCLIGDLRLSGDSDGAFSVTPIESLELPAGAMLRVPVTFAPARLHSDLTGAVQFQVSNRDEPLRRVPLRGTAATPCLEIDPLAIDFGKTGPGCRTREHVVEIRNRCSEPTTLTGMRIEEDGGTGAFVIGSHLNLPLVLPRFRESIEVRPYFAPPSLGRRSGTLWLEAGTDRYPVELEGVGETNAVQTDPLERYVLVGMGATFPLRGTPEDRNGDGRTDEKDIDFLADGRPTPTIGGAGVLVWMFDAAHDAISVIYPVPGPYSATYNVKCIR